MLESVETSLYIALDHMSTSRYPKPFYQPSPLTARINMFGAGLLGLPTPMRRILRPDDIEIDLVSAHPTIFAAIFRLPLLGRALADDTLWSSLASELGDGWAPKEAKTVLKGAAVLPLFYGSEDHQIKYRLKHAGIDEAAIARVMAQPIMQEVRVARDTVIERIKSEDGMQGIDGQEVSLTEVLEHKGKVRRDNGTWVGGECTLNSGARSVLALVIQSYEWALMAPVRQAAIEEARGGGKKFLISAWQHDGCSLHFLRGGQKDRIVGKLIAEVKARGEDLGIPVRAETK